MPKITSIKFKITAFSLLLFGIILLLISRYHSKYVVDLLYEQQMQNYGRQIERVKNLFDSYNTRLKKIGLVDEYREEFEAQAINTFKNIFVLNSCDSLNYLGILDSNYHVLSDLNFSYGSVPVYKDKLEKNKSMQKFSYKIKNESRWIFIVYYKPWKWYITLNKKGIENTEIVSHYSQKLNFFLIVFFVSYIVLLNLFLFLFFLPVKNIIKNVKKFKDGDLKTPINYKNDDEVKPLINTIEAARIKILNTLDELENTNNTMKLVFKAVGDGYWDWNINSGKIFFSPEYYTMAGYEEGDFEGSYDNWESRLHSDDKANAIKAVLDCKDKKTSFIYVQFRFLKKDGSYMWLLGRGSVVEHNKDGSVARMIGTHTDIGYQKKLEEKLYENEKKYRAIYNNVTDAIFVHDPDSGNVIDLNETATKMYKIKSKSEIYGKTIDSFSAAEDGYTKENAFEHIRKAKENGIDKFEWLAVKKGGRKFFVEVSLVFVKFANKNVVLAIVKDINNERKAKIQLINMHKYLKNIFDSMPSVLISVDKNGYVKNWNIEAVKKTKIKEKDAVGRYIVDLLPSYEKELANISKVAESRVKMEIEDILQENTDGVEYDNMILYPLIANGIAGTVIKIDDVTDKKRIENLLMQSEKMTTVATLAAGMAHEINNPLGGILQSMQNIKRRLDPKFSKNHEFAEKYDINLEKLYKYLKNRNILYYFDGIMASGKRAAKIVGNMLQFSRNSDSRSTKVDINILIGKCIDFLYSDYDLKKNYDFKDISFEYDFTEDITKLQVNESEIEQVVFNILKNSAQAIFIGHGENDKKGIINIKTYEKHGYVVVAISDNGPGIEEEIQHRIFEPFFTTKPVGVGTGLGLSISYMMITKNYGGNLYLETKVGKRTTFYIELPKQTRKVK